MEIGKAVKVSRHTAGPGEQEQHPPAGFAGRSQQGYETQGSSADPELLTEQVGMLGKGDCPSWDCPC